MRDEASRVACIFYYQRSVQPDVDVSLVRPVHTEWIFIWMASKSSVQLFLTCAGETLPRRWWHVVMNKCNKFRLSLQSAQLRCLSLLPSAGFHIALIWHLRSSLPWLTVACCLLLPIEYGTRIVEQWCSWVPLFFQPKGSHCRCLFSYSLFMPDRIVAFSLRAAQATHETQRFSLSLTAYIQSDLALGYIGIASDLCNLLRAMLVIPTYGSETYIQSTEAQSLWKFWLTTAKLSDPELNKGPNRRKFPRLPPEGTPDHPRTRLWIQRGTSYAGYAFLAATVTGTIASGSFVQTVRGETSAHRIVVLRWSTFCTIFEMRKLTMFTATLVLPSPPLSLCGSLELWYGVIFFFQGWIDEAVSFSALSLAQWWVWIFSINSDNFKVTCTPVRWWLRSIAFRSCTISWTASSQWARSRSTAQVIKPSSTYFTSFQSGSVLPFFSFPMRAKHSVQVSWVIGAIMTRLLKSWKSDWRERRSIEKNSSCRYSHPLHLLWPNILQKIPSHFSCAKIFLHSVENLEVLLTLIL